MKIARVLFAILAIAAVSISCSGDMPTEPQDDVSCPVQGGPWC